VVTSKLVAFLVGGEPSMQASSRIRGHQTLGCRPPLKTRQRKIILLNQTRVHPKTKTICEQISFFELAYCKGWSHRMLLSYAFESEFRSRLCISRNIYLQNCDS
jgi:hypothetical protein